MIPFLLLAFFLAPQDKPPDKCTVSGTAVNSVTGEPLGKVQIYLQPAASSEAPLASTITDAKGAFTLVNLDPGAYRLRGVRNGYLEAYYGARHAGSKGVVLTIEPARQADGIALKLTPFGVVAGTVTDPEGEPLTGVKVRLLAVTFENGRRQIHAVDFDYQSAITDDLGQYRIAGVKPGRYYVRAAPRRVDRQDSALDHSPEGHGPPETLVPTFHPASRELEGARRLDVPAGGRVTGADITLLRSRLYRVRVHTSAPPGMEFGVALEDRVNLNDGFSISPSSHEKGQGVFEFWAVPSGSYVVKASASPPNQVFRGPDDLFFNNHEFRAVTLVDVVSADVDDVRVVVQSGSEVTGRVTVEDPQPADLRASVRFVAADGEDHNASVNADRSFTTLLSQGRYEVRAFANGGLVVKSIRTESTDVLQEGLTISGPAKTALEVVFSHDGGRMEGTVSDKEDKPAPGAIVALIPDKLRSRHDLYRQTETDQNGRFLLENLAPGEYKLFAWEDVEPGIWFDPEFLKDVEARGETATVHPKGQETVKLHVIAGQ